MIELTFYPMCKSHNARYLQCLERGLLTRYDGVFCKSRLVLDTEVSGAFSPYFSRVRSPQQRPTFLNVHFRYIRHLADPVGMAKKNLIVCVEGFLAQSS